MSSGTIPESLGGLKSLTVMYLSANQLSGIEPLAYGVCVYMCGLLLRLGCFLVGTFGALVYMGVQVSCCVSMSTGAIPESLGRLTNLTELFIDSNQLSGIEYFSCVRILRGFASFFALGRLLIMFLRALANMERE